MSLINFEKDYENIIISSSPNKTFNLAGVCGSYLLIKNKILHDKIKNTFLKNKLEINRVGYEFLVACYENGHNWVDSLRENIKENLKIVEILLDNEGIEVMTPESGYLVWVRLNKVNDSLEFVEKLARESGVLLESGTRFVDGENGYIRINIATSKTIIEKSMRELNKFYDEFIKKEAVT
ncbi:aminotransferase class I/II-fold pyridoxal phosphate-dependent enzyme [Paraclostridium sp. AKS81]|uniref:aminotransferase class I/II-fold pyridoxal phosphate-dependent enzyme n=1 Tax=Paraclostridium sp. AKS81 TaxID=2876117 RepID=UPI002958B3B3|nr:aminotransferase class I/II-fold pyridoxal phosphate-dependent enzyme [Paraclostridium sp. AKS81]